METHFIEQYKDDLFISACNTGIAQEACNAMRRGASIAAACIWKMELAASRDSAPGKFKLVISGNLFFNSYKFLIFFNEQEVCFCGMLILLLESIIWLVELWNLKAMMSITIMAQKV